MRTARTAAYPLLSGSMYVVFISYIYSTPFCTDAIETLKPRRGIDDSVADGDLTEALIMYGYITFPCKLHRQTSCSCPHDFG
ncbi:hypothetical protein OF83DRAFT_1144391 [Amylostereum chailletii]|nr:hypothetical protein OF83DRAFT_1144391 [Amylostereum chailletii]